MLTGLSSLTAIAKRAATIVEVIGPGSVDDISGEAATGRDRQKLLGAENASCRATAAAASPTAVNLVVSRPNKWRIGTITRCFK
jgi:hypothetical protein